MNRFSKQIFKRLASNIEAVKKLLSQVTTDADSQKLIDQINKFFKIIYCLFFIKRNGCAL